MQERRKAERLSSRARAVSAANGAVATTGTALLIMEEIAAEGDFNARSRLYGGETRATSLENQAKVTRFQGDQAFASSLIDGTSTLLKGASKTDFNKLGFG
jgi:hypothetical protein